MEKKKRELIERTVSTVEDVQEWFGVMDRTVQITYRIQRRPRFAVRVFHPGDERNLQPLAYAVAEDDDLGRAIERALEAWAHQNG